MPEVIVHVPSALLELTGGRPTLRVHAATVDEVLLRIRESEPLLSGRLFGRDGAVRGYVNLFLNGVDVRSLDADSRSIDSDAELSIVPSVAGG